jgi:Protein of unknown function (DUF2891)
MTIQMSNELAERFAKIALSHIIREFPAKMDHVLTGPQDIQSPRALHPMFHGSFDWHSCVHAFWLLAKILRIYPGLPQASAIRSLFDAQLTSENAEGEREYLNRPMQGNFERPYGWSWLLMLASELAQHKNSEGQIWSNNLRPLTQLLAERFKAYLATLPYPIRAGTHPNTAFAAALAIEYGQVCNDAELLNATRKRMVEYFGGDTDCRAFEPSGNEFHSPILIEVECMRRVLPTRDFAEWLDRFLPRLMEREPRVLFEPVAVIDQADPQIVHLDGLNFSRAWCWRLLAKSLPPGDPRGVNATVSAEAHIRESLPHIGVDYMGEHWLATYAMLALSA